LWVSWARWGLQSASSDLARACLKQKLQPYCKLRVASFTIFGLDERMFKKDTQGISSWCSSVHSDGPCSCFTVHVPINLKLEMKILQDRQGVRAGTRGSACYTRKLEDGMPHCSSGHAFVEGCAELSLKQKEKGSVSIDGEGREAGVARIE